MLELFIALVTFAVTMIVMYFKVIEPMRWHLRCIKGHNDHLHSELVKHQRILKDVQKWIEIESTSKPEIGKAIKQRIAQRMEE